MLFHSPDASVFQDEQFWNVESLHRTCSVPLIVLVDFLVPPFCSTTLFWREDDSSYVQGFKVCSLCISVVR